MWAKNKASLKIPPSNPEERFIWKPRATIPIQNLKYNIWNAS